jgi:D-alanyl-D-alanine carboxypeptidase (penicillin-binding protein 5/6)
MALTALVVACTLSLPAVAAGGDASAATPPVLHGKAAVVYDASTGRFLYSRNGDQELPMASLTKMMTALVALRDWHDDTSRRMVVPPDVTKTYGEVIYLQPGEVYTFRDLLLALLLESANDAAVTIAVNVAGSQAAFVDEMNEEAGLLGLTETHFANVHGLDAPDHFSSAHDLALLGAAAMTDPVFREIVGLPHATIPWPAKGSTRDLYNINRLITGFPGADGIKTGYTTDALNCVVGSANRGGHEVIAVVMGEGPYWVWRDESALLSYGLQAAQAIPLPPPPPTLPMVVRAAAAAGTAKAADQPAGAADVRSGGSPWAMLAGITALGGMAAAVRRRARPRRWRLRRIPRLEPIPHSRIARQD